jgi:hypothetical protein
MGRPSERCLTHGVTDFDALATPRRIIQTPGHDRDPFRGIQPLPTNLPRWPSSPSAYNQPIWAILSANGKATLR